jgi:hypothetical protein
MGAGLVTLSFLDRDPDLVVDPELNFRDPRLRRARERLRPVVAEPGCSATETFGKADAIDLLANVQYFDSDLATGAWRTQFMGLCPMKTVGRNMTGRVVTPMGGRIARRITSMLDLVKAAGLPVREYTATPMQTARGVGMIESLWMPMMTRAGAVAAVAWVAFFTEIGGL